MTLLTKGRSIRVLDMDSENRPLTYWQPDNPTADLTAIATCWADDHDSMEVMVLGEVTTEEMLVRFVERYNEADIVTAHFIRGHDLPIINAHLMEFGFPILSPKMTCDTKLDMVKKSDLPATQEYLIDLLEPVCPIGMPVYKEHMGQHDWRRANRLDASGLERTRIRVSSDVHSHIHLRESMLQRGMLKAPRLWQP